MSKASRHSKSLRTLKVKVQLDNISQLKLETLSNEHRLLYNFLLQHTKQTKTCDFKVLNELSRDFRKEHNLTISTKSAQNTTRLFIQNIKSFYSLRKKDKTAHFPYKFKSHKFFTSFMHDVNGGNFDKFALEPDKLVLKLCAKQTLEIPLPQIVKARINKENLKTVTFYHKANAYWISFSYEVENLNPQSLLDESFLSIDLGLKSIASCFSNVSHSFSIENSRFKQVERRKNLVQSKMDKCKVGSRRHKKLSKTFRKLNRKKSNKSIDFQHKVSRQIIKHCQEHKISQLIIGDIQTKKLTKGKFKSRGLNKSSQNEGTLSRFKTFLSYKAQESGMLVSLVNEAYTSQENSLTGERNLSSALGVRQVELAPELKIDRDLNSAINISKRIKPRWFRHFDQQALKEVASTYQEMYYDTHQECLMRK
jgi:putative transposase